MAEVNTDEHGFVEVDVDDFLEECSSHEIDEVISWLEMEGHIPEPPTSNAPHRNTNDVIWNETVSKLIDAKHRLTNQDEMKVLSVTDKL